MPPIVPGPLLRGEPLRPPLSNGYGIRCALRVAPSAPAPPRALRSLAPWAPCRVSTTRGRRAAPHRVFWTLG
ncbi:hypothetical protein, partial [Microbacterium flavum]|uniref:hypothetical protein n=1 Tax=Microbacterium flavum TaxID=415216 RepID=UPI0024ACEFA6